MAVPSDWPSPRVPTHGIRLPVNVRVYQLSVTSTWYVGCSEVNIKPEARQYQQTQQGHDMGLPWCLLINDRNKDCVVSEETDTLISPNRTPYMYGYHNGIQFQNGHIVAMPLYGPHIIKFSTPMRDWSSLSVTFCLCVNSKSKAQAFNSLSSGSLASMQTASKIIPKNVMEEEGPTVLPGARGTPSWWQRSIKAIKSCSHLPSEWAIKRKSSITSTTSVAPNLYLATHSKAELKH